MKIIIFGGTFDPPHLGHYQIIRRCLTICDKIILVPTKQSPHKNLKPSASVEDRKKMLQVMISEMSGDIIIESFELESNETPNYTIDTIKYLNLKYIDANLFLVVGQDQYINFNKWKSYKMIKDLVKVICIHRPDFKNINKKNCTFIDDISCRVSSSLIRLKANENVDLIKDFVPRQVLSYIKESKIYS